MANNDFLPFGTNIGANVMSQADYSAMAARVNGFSSGTANSAQLNKAWRQSSVMSSVLAQFIADRSNEDVLDNGNLGTIQNNLGVAISAAVADYVPYASQAEAVAGTVSTKAMSPLNVAQVFASKAQASLTDTTAGKLLTTSSFGLGAPGGGPVQVLNSAFVPGFYRYGASDPSVPTGTTGAGGSFIVSTGGSNFVQQLALTVPASTSNPYMGLRSFDAGGNPGPWVSFYHTGNLGQATESVAGLQKISTQAQTNAGVDDSTSVTPLKLFNWFSNKFGQATETVLGLVKIATNIQVTAGADDTAAVTSLKLKNKTQSSATDTTAGRFLTPGAFGLGTSSGGPTVSLSTAFTSGLYTYSVSDPAAPGGAGSGGSVLISSAGGNYIQQLAITTPVSTSNPLVALRAFDGGGAPGPWVNMYHTGNIGAVDPWLMQPIGALVALRDDLAGVTAPSTTAGYRYVVLSASTSYNSGALISESVVGTAPLVIATAVISLAGSPLNGRTINLINTERRVLRSGSSGNIEQDALQSHGHTELVGSPNTTSSTSDTTSSYASGLSAAGAYSQRLPSAGTTNNVAIGQPNTDAAAGSVRTSNETRVKSVGVTYYMRIK